MRTGALVALLALAVAGCFGRGSEDEIPASALPSLVLDQADLPPSFSRFDFGKQVQADFLPGAREDPQRFGREGGWKARFRRAGDVTTTGPLVVESRADVFPSADGAERDLDAYADQYELQAADSAGSGRLADTLAIGDEAVVLELEQPGSPGTQLYAIAWRERNATASVTVTGILRRLELGSAVALARKQERRLRAFGSSVTTGTN